MLDAIAIEFAVAVIEIDSVLSENERYTESANAAATRAATAQEVTSGSRDLNLVMAGDAEPVS